MTSLDRRAAKYLAVAQVQAIAPRLPIKAAWHSGEDDDAVSDVYDYDPVGTPGPGRSARARK